MTLGSVVSTTRGTLLKGHSVRNGTEKHWTGDGHEGPRDEGVAQRSPRFCSIWPEQVTSPCSRTGSTDRPSVLEIKVLGGRVWDKHTSPGVWGMGDSSVKRLFRLHRPTTGLGTPSMPSLLGGEQVCSPSHEETGL